MINILREPYAKRTDTVDPATEKQKQDAKKEESSDSESEGDDAADSGSESESEDEDEEPKKSEEDKTSDDANPINIKLPASSTNSPSVEAPSAEGSMSDSPLVSQILDPFIMSKSFWIERHVKCIESSVLLTPLKVEGGDGMHSNVHKILLGVGSVGMLYLSTSPITLQTANTISRRLSIPTWHWLPHLEILLKEAVTKEACSH
jgi:hypothetical protein